MAVKKLIYEGEHFLIEKLSSFTDIYLKRNLVKYNKIKCTLGFKINFSGSELKVERNIIIPRYEWNGTYSKFLGVFKYKNDVEVPAYNKALNSNQIFTYENYRNKFHKEPEDFNRDFMKWIAEELDIEKDYEWIMEQYDFSHNAIKKYQEGLKEDENKKS